MLVIPLVLSGADFLVFFRKSQEEEIHWAGNPHEKEILHGTDGYLEPRSSFNQWTESVIGTSREWSEDEVDAATILSILYGRFIEVWRQNEAIVQKNRMTRLLIRNAGHEVRTPLNGVINYLEVALEEVLDERARQHLQRSLQASKSLVFVVNDLLNLTEAETSEVNIHKDDVDLRYLVNEVVTAYSHESMAKFMNVELDMDETLPKLVRCDRGGLRQVLSNFLDNAIRQQSRGLVKITLLQSSFSENSGSSSNCFFASKLPQRKLRILIAEDNPLNSRLLDTRLSKRGHQPIVAVNGEVCVETFKNDLEPFDAILMDLQMPLLDGMAATQKIRQFETENSSILSQNIRSYSRIPIIAVSASLSESALKVYIESGLDGWILKPIDFARLEVILAAVDVRECLIYGKGDWKKGGWFEAMHTTG